MSFNLSDRVDSCKKYFGGMKERVKSYRKFTSHNIYNATQELRHPSLLAYGALESAAAFCSKYAPVMTFLGSNKDREVLERVVMGPIDTVNLLYSASQSKMPESPVGEGFMEQLTFYVGQGVETLDSAAQIAIPMIHNIQNWEESLTAALLTYGLCKGVEVATRATVNDKRNAFAEKDGFLPNYVTPKRYRDIE